jgi:nicotinamide riboside transporter PnuC
MVEMLGWLGFVCLIIGYVLNAKKHISCFYFWALGNILMIVYAYIISALPQIATAVVVLLMNIYGYYQWKHN